MKIKKVIYITLFTFLGIILSSILHALIEILMINLLISDFKKYSLGLTWQQLYLVHHVLTLILFIAGVMLGTFLGFKYWKKVYK